MTDQTHDGEWLAFVSRHRVFFLTSPLWFAAILVLLSLTSAPFREVIQFMTATR